MIRSVILVPHDKPHKKDPYGLLSDGPCGSRPPRAYKSTAKNTMGKWRPMVSTSNLFDKKMALVLAWEGDLVHEGIGRYERSYLNATPGALARELRAVLGGTEFSNATSERGRVVCLDENGMEVKW